MRVLKSLKIKAARLLRQLGPNDLLELCDRSTYNHLGLKLSGLSAKCSKIPTVYQRQINVNEKTPAASFSHPNS